MYADDGDGTHGWWISMIFSVGFAVRVLANARSIGKHAARICFGLLRYAYARARGDNNHLTLKDYIAVVRPRSPIASMIQSNKTIFTPTKEFNKILTRNDSALATPVRELVRRANEHLEEPEFAIGAGGSDGFAPEYASLRSRHTFQSIAQTSADFSRRDLSRSISTTRCNEDGCNERWGAAKRRIRHFCGVCQAWYCEKHTRVSPHGSRGVCKPESRCMCMLCYASLSKEQQKALDADNKYSVNRVEDTKKSKLFLIKYKAKKVVKKTKRIGSHAQDTTAKIAAFEAKQLR
jgi:hypothetical protein